MRTRGEFLEPVGLISIGLYESLLNDGKKIFVVHYKMMIHKLQAASRRLLYIKCMNDCIRLHNCIAAIIRSYVTHSQLLPTQRRVGNTL